MGWSEDRWPSEADDLRHRLDTVMFDLQKERLAHANTRFELEAANERIRVLLEEVGRGGV
jgi:hypothetical protein